jgi:thiol-disulfide isomerase/thioredoxin
MRIFFSNMRVFPLKFPILRKYGMVFAHWNQKFATPMACDSGVIKFGNSLLVASLIVLAAGCDKVADKHLAIGERLPEFPLADFSGRTKLSTAFSGKVLIVNFWASWCVPCRSEMPGLVHLASTLDPRHYQVIGISVDSDQFLAEEFLRQSGLSFPNFHDPEKIAWKDPQAALLLADLLVGNSGGKG